MSTNGFLYICLGVIALASLTSCSTAEEHRYGPRLLIANPAPQSAVNPGMPGIPDQGTASDQQGSVGDVAPSSREGYLIGPGDILQLSFYAGGEKHEDFVAEVSSKGTITAPLIGDVPVTGLMPSDISEKIGAILGKNFYKNPQVLVNVKEYGKKVYISGEVKNPGAYGIQEGLTVLNACTLAGGFTDYAAPGRVNVTRMEEGKFLIIPLDLNKVQKGKERDLRLKAGDRIDVPQRWF